MRIRQGLATFMTIMSILVIAGAAVYTLQQAITIKGVPIKLHSIRVLEQNAVPGDTVNIEVDRTVLRYCPGTVMEFWHNIDNNQVTQGYMRPAMPYIEVGRVKSVFTKVLPDDISSGRVCYEPILVYNCPEATISYQQPAACLNVFKRGF